MNPKAPELVTFTLPTADVDLLAEAAYEYVYALQNMENLYNDLAEQEPPDGYYTQQAKSYKDLAERVSTIRRTLVDVLGSVGYYNRPDYTQPNPFDSL